MDEADKTNGCDWNVETIFVTGYDRAENGKEFISTVMDKQR